MTLTIELSESDAERLRELAEDAHASEAEFARAALVRTLQDPGNKHARRKSLASLIQELEPLRATLSPLPEEAFHRSSYYEE